MLIGEFVGAVTQIVVTVAPAALGRMPPQVQLIAAISHSSDVRGCEPIADFPVPLHQTDGRHVLPHNELAKRLSCHWCSNSAAC